MEENFFSCSNLEENLPLLDLEITQYLKNNTPFKWWQQREQQEVLVLEEKSGQQKSELADLFVERIEK